MVDLGLNLFAGLAMVGGIVLAPFTGGASLYATYAGGTYLAGSSAYSAVTGNTLITGDRLSGVERTFAGIEAVTTVLSLGGTAVGSSGLKVGNQATKVLTTFGNVANKTDDVMEVVQLGYGIGTGDAESALAKFALGKGMEFGTKAVVGNLTKGLSVHTPQVQLNARQGQEFVDLQVVEFGKVAHKVEKNITIQMVVDGVEQKIRVDAIGFDEAGKIRVQEYTTAQTGLKSSRQNLLEDLSQYGGVIVGAGKGDFVGGVEIPKGTRIDVVSQKTGNVTIGDIVDTQDSSSIYSLDVTDMVSKYNDIYAYKFNSTTNPGPLAELSSKPNRNFYGGRYSILELDNDVVLYRAGRGDNPMGQWFTTEPPFSRAQVRIDTAVKDIWTTPDGVFTGQSPIDKVYKIRIPKGTTIYEGPVGTQGGIYQGGLDKTQIFIDSPWNIERIEVLDSWSIIP